MNQGATASVAMDITGLLNGDVSLSSFFYRELFRCFHAGNNYYFVLNAPEEKMEYLSPEIKTTLGLSETLSLQALLERVHPDDRSFYEKYKKRFEAFFIQLDDDRKTSYKLSFDFRIRNGSGKYSRILHQEIPVLHAEGRLIKSLCIHTDISSLKRFGSPEINFMGLDGAETYYHDDIYPDKLAADDGLSKKERMVLGLILKRKKSQEIAEIMGISINTVNNHRKNILRKTGCGTPQKLLRKYSG